MGHLRKRPGSASYTWKAMKARVEILNVAERMREKAASREADARAVASGEKAYENLRKENAAFAFPPERVRIDFSRIKSKR